MTRSTLILLAVALLLFVPLLSGCPHAPRAGAPLAAPAATPAPVTVNLWTIWNTEPRQSALAGMVREFEAANPGIKIKVSTFEPDAYKTQIKVALGVRGADAE